MLVLSSALWVTLASKYDLLTRLILHSRGREVEAIVESATPTGETIRTRTTRRRNLPPLPWYRITYRYPGEDGQSHRATIVSYDEELVRHALTSGTFDVTYDPKRPESVRPYRHMAPLNDIPQFVFGGCFPIVGAALLISGLREIASCHRR